MRITRDPHDPDHVIQFDQYNVTANGSPLKMESILEVDQEKGLVKMFYKTFNDQGKLVCQPKPNTDPMQPDSMDSPAADIQIIAPAICAQCTQKAHYALKRRQAAAEKWWEAV